MSLDTTQPPLATNAAQEKGGNLDSIRVAGTLTVPELLQRILLELKINNELLNEGFGLNRDIDRDYRNDSNFSDVR